MLRHMDTKRLISRVGYAAHAVVYLLVGSFAIATGLGVRGRQPEGSAGAISELASGPFPIIILTTLAVGLIAYSFMRFWQGLFNPTNQENNASGIAARAGCLVSGTAYAALAFYTLSLIYTWPNRLIGLTPASSSQGESDSTKELTAAVMSNTGGRWMIAIAGVVVCAVAIAQLVKAIKADFMQQLDVDEKKKAWIEPLGRIGYAARSVIYFIIGGFLVVAAYRADPSNAEGLSGALGKLLEQPYGPWLLTAVGAGFIAFAVFRLIFARYATTPERHS